MSADGARGAEGARSMAPGEKTEEKDGRGGGSKNNDVAGTSYRIAVKYISPTQPAVRSFCRRKESDDPVSPEWKPGEMERVGGGRRANPLTRIQPRLPDRSGHTTFTRRPASRTDSGARRRLSPSVRGDAFLRLSLPRSSLDPLPRLYRRRLLPDGKNAPSMDSSSYRAVRIDFAMARAIWRAPKKPRDLRLGSFHELPKLRQSHRQTRPSPTSPRFSSRSTLDRTSRSRIVFRSAGFP